MPNRTLKKIVGYYKTIHMKKIKKTSVAALMLFIGSSLFISCSNDNEIDNKDSSNAVIDQFLKSFYNEDYVLGNTISISNGTKSSVMSRTVLVDGQDIEITEVILGNGQRVRGYVITDKITSAFLYFVDVDRTTYDLTVVDVINNQTLIFKNINTNPDYRNTKEFDLFEMAENYNQSNAQERFWGWIIEQGPCNETNESGTSGNGLAFVYNNYYVFGIKVQSIQQMGTDSTGNEIPLREPCGSRPK